jgi:hypothetical protein
MRISVWIMPLWRGSTPWKTLLVRGYFFSFLSLLVGGAIPAVLFNT